MPRRGRCASAGKNICEAAALTIRAAKEFFQGSKLTPMQQEIAGQHSARDSAAAAFSRCGGTGLPDAGPAGIDPVGRRVAANSAGDVAWVAAGGRAVRAGRAVDRTAHARYGAADPHPRKPARSGQHDSGRRARSGCDSLGRSPARPGSGCGRVWRTRAGGRHGGGDRSESRFADGKISLRADDDSGADAATRGRARHETGWLRGARANNLRGLDVEIPLGMLVGDHRRVGVGQIDAGARGAVSRDRAPARQDGGRRSRRMSYREIKGVGAAERCGSGRSDADRADAAVESDDVHQGLRSIRELVCGAAGGEAASLRRRDISPSTCRAAAAIPARATAR